MSAEDPIMQPDGAGEEPAPQLQADEQAAPHDGVVPVAAHPEAEAPDVAPIPDPPVEPDFRDLYLRERAEVENVRKRARRDIENAHGRGVARLAKELLPALDNLERALAHAEAEEGEGEHEITRGIRLVQQELVIALERVGIVADAPKGELFDPHRHEAVAHAAVDGVASGTITDVYSAGYRFGEDVLRAAKVVVAQ